MHFTLCPFSLGGSHPTKETHQKLAYISAEHSIFSPKYRYWYHFLGYETMNVVTVDPAASELTQLELKTYWSPMNDTLRFHGNQFVSSIHKFDWQKMHAINYIEFLCSGKDTGVTETPISSKFRTPLSSNQRLETLPTHRWRHCKDLCCALGSCSRQCSFWCFLFVPTPSKTVSQSWTTSCASLTFNSQYAQ